MTRRTLFALLSGWCVACSSSAPPGPVPLKVLHQGSQCSKTEAGIEQILDIANLDHYLRPRVPLGLGGNDRVNEDWPELSADDKIFLISMGQQRSGGYAVSLAATTGAVVSQTLELPISFEYPSPDSMQTQQLTTPCLIVVAGPGAYKKARVLARPKWHTPVQ